MLHSPPTTASNATTTYTYAETGYANPHAVTSVGGATYSYDNNGNVTAIVSLDYTWDWRNRLASAERTGGGITSYGYDQSGQRVFKATGTATTSYPNKYYNLATTTGAATTTKHIFAPDGTLLATVVGASTTATTTYLHPDHLGGTNVTTDEGGEVTQTLDYYPYGSQRIASGSFSEQRRFIGEEYDGDTEFSYLNARYYEGGRGQFLSQDPVFVNLGVDGRSNSLLLDPQLQNAYAYSRNNPLRLSDRDGEMPTIVAGAIAGTGIGLATQGLSDAMHRQFSGWQAYTGAAAGGAVQGAFWGSGAGFLGLAFTGALSGATQGGVREGLQWASGDPNSFELGAIGQDIGASIFGNVAGGGLTKVFGVPKISGSTAYRSGYSSLSKQMFTKLNNGSISSISPNTYAKMGAAYGDSNIYSIAMQVAIQSRYEAVQGYNASNGFTAPQDKLWTTPNGTVINWSGQIISAAP